MDINLNNYEEYLLLYADNELDQEARLAVERFLEEHPQLKSELELLTGTKLQPASHSPVHATTLLKLPSGISAEEALLLECDGEISALQKKELDVLCSEFASLKSERELMASVKLDRAEQMSFADKSLLYRHESRVISLRLWKPAIAAALIGVGLFFGLEQRYKADETELVGIQENGPVVEEYVPGPDTSLITTGEQQSKATASQEVNGATTVPNKKEAAATSRQNNAKPNRDKSEVDGKELKVTTNNKTKTVLENFNNTPRNIHAYTPVLPMKRKDMNMVPPAEVKVEVERLTASKPLDADLSAAKNVYANTTAAQTENTASIGHILFVDEEKVNRSKFGGFVRKVKRTIEKKTNINLPDGFKVAGFEIAIK